MGQVRRLQGTEELISQIYRSSAGIIPYAQVAEDFMRLMRSSLVMAHVHDKAAERNVALLGEGIDDGQMRAYEEYYGGVNFIHERAVPVLLEDGYGQSAQVATDAEMIASEFHNDFQKPIGYFHSCGCMVDARDDRVYSVILGRARRLGLWDESEMGTLAVVQHHLSAALEVRSHLHSLEAMRHAVDMVAESLEEAVFILGRNDDLLFANEAGKALIKRAAPVRMHEGKLTVVGRRNGSRWAAALRQARGRHASAALTVYGAPGALPHATTVVSARNTPSLLDLGSEADLIVFIHDPAHPAPTIRHLQLAFELTRREAEVVILLAEGLNPKAIATSLRVGVETVRSHIKRSLLKAGAHSQADLVSRVLRSVQPIHAGS